MSGIHRVGNGAWSAPGGGGGVARSGVDLLSQLVWVA